MMRGDAFVNFFLKKESALSLSYRTIFMRLLSLNRPEWLFIVVGCIACMIVGVIYPLHAVIAAKMINVSQFFTGELICYVE